MLPYSSNSPSDDEFNYFDISVDNLAVLMQYHGKLGADTIKKFGGVNHLCDLLRTTPAHGISTNSYDLKKRKKAFGENFIHLKKSKSYWSFVVHSLKDPTLIFLEAACALSIAVGFFLTFMHKEKSHYVDMIEGVVILVSIIIIVLITAGTDYKKEQQFRSLKKRLKEEQKITVIRDGLINDISVEKLLVGDICLIKIGNIIPADGIILQSNDLKVDEATVTGEADITTKAQSEDMILLGGTRVMEGTAKVLITAVGINSHNGLILRLVGLFDDSEEETNKKLTRNEPSTSRKLTATKTISSTKKIIYALPAIKQIRMSVLQKARRESFTDIVKTHEGSILQKKLYKITLRITNFAICTAILTVIILYINFVISFFTSGKDWDSSYLLLLIRYLIVGISILIVGIPEGLPLAVTLALAYSVKKMMADNNLVRNLSSCETMGNATTICSDKTGTLTTNRMTCVELYACENMYATEIKIPKLSDIVPSRVQFLIIEGISINTSYTSYTEKQIDGTIKYFGDKTECALLGLALNLSGNYQSIRNLYPDNEFIHVYSFNSERKSMTTIIRKSKTRLRLYIKGGADIILKYCKYMYNRNGEVEELNDVLIQYINDFIISRMGNSGLRTIILAYRDFTYEKTININEMFIEKEPNWNNEFEIINNLTMICVTGIEDPLRPDVYVAIKLCQTAGITVRMITGDNIQTAKSIALKSGIITKVKDLNDPGIVLEGPEFNRLIHDENGKVDQTLLDMVWPNLRVLARSKPIDKYNLVKGIIESNIEKGGQVVAVTGDGTNDGPALKIADIGFAMGLSGTDVAKEASDVILTDDNFSSIVKAVMWGRNVYDSIVKFLQFQVTVNFVAVTITFIGAWFRHDTVLKSVQLLWVNLIMDALGSLALATEKPRVELLHRKPYGRTQTLISPIMWKNIITQSIYQITILVGILIYTYNKIDHDILSSNLENRPMKHTTIIFNTLVMMTLFNEFNARKVHGEYNCCDGILDNPTFFIIWIIQFIIQVLIIQFGGILFSTTPLTIYEWSYCIFFGISTLLWAQIWNRISIEKFVRKHYHRRTQKDPADKTNNQSIAGRNDSRASKLFSQNQLNSLKNMYQGN